MAGINLAQDRAAGEKALSAGVDVPDHLCETVHRMIGTFHGDIRPSPRSVSWRKRGAGSIK